MMAPMTGRAERDEIRRGIVPRLAVDVMDVQPRPGAQVATRHPRIRPMARHALTVVPLQDEWPHLAEPLGVARPVPIVTVAGATHLRRVCRVLARHRAEARS